MKKIIVLYVLVALAIIVSGISLYKSFKTPRIGFIDNQVAYDSFSLSKELNLKLESFSLKYESVLDSLNLELTKRTANLDMNDTLAVKQFLYFKNYCKDQSEQYYSSYQELSMEYNEQILKQMNQYIHDFGKLNNYQIVLGANGQGSLLYADDNIDVTKEAVEFINKKYAGY